VTLVGTTGVAANFAQGMDFDNRTGRLYLYAYLGGGANRYGTVDLKTGAFTPLASNDPQGEFEGATQTRCPPPQTTITRAPRKRTTSRWAVFRFEASVRGSSFECSLDGRPWTRCASPVFRRVRPGDHRFAVRASDAAGNMDPTPAVDRWRVRGR
jgi:hypothetical protein